MARRLGRVVAGGKHLSLDGETFRVRGVTYGTFGPRADGELFPDTASVDADLAAIPAAGPTSATTTAPSGGGYARRGS